MKELLSVDITSLQGFSRRNIVTLQGLSSWISCTFIWMNFSFSRA